VDELRVPEDPNEAFELGYECGRDLLEFYVLSLLGNLVYGLPQWGRTAGWSQNPDKIKVLEQELAKYQSHARWMAARNREREQKGR
jgi:hypothetical protein